MYLRFGAHRVDLRLVIGVTLALAVVAVGITLAVMLPGRPVDTRDSVTAADEEREQSWVRLEHLLLPDELEESTQTRPVAYRELRDRWAAGDAQEHWIDPRQIGLDVLDQEVTAAIRKVLEEVP